MKSVISGLLVAFSMYSAIPVPQVNWEKQTMRWALGFLPLIGVLIGAIEWFWFAFCMHFGAAGVFYAVIAALIPLAVSGGIHLDGYSDTCDALASHASQEKKLEILKDPHVGSFAVIRICGYFVITLALWSALKSFPWAAVLLGFCMSRTLSGLAVASFPLAKNTGLAHTFAQAADQKRVRRVLIVLDIVLFAGMCLCGYSGVLMALTAHVVFGDYYRMSKRQFGGLSGDLAGWFLQTAELWMLLVLTATQYGEVLL